jgi:hypothetical protein
VQPEQGGVKLAGFAGARGARGAGRQETSPPAGGPGAGARRRIRSGPRGARRRIRSAPRGARRGRRARGADFTGSMGGEHGRGAGLRPSAPLSSLETDGTQKTESFGRPPHPQGGCRPGPGSRPSTGPGPCVVPRRAETWRTGFKSVGHRDRAESGRPGGQPGLRRACAGPGPLPCPLPRPGPKGAQRRRSPVAVCASLLHHPSYIPGPLAQRRELPALKAAAASVPMARQHPSRY